MAYRKKSFTLIELLVVIGIIAMLMGFLLPSLSAAKQIAKKVTCMSNIRQMGIITQLYTNDWDGRYMPAWNVYVTPTTAWCGSYSNVGGVRYMDVTESPLWPYMQEKQVMRCNSFKPQEVKYAGSGQISGYGINSQYVAGDPVVDASDGYFGMSSYSKPARTGHIKRPGETILFGDCARWKNDAVKEEIFIYPRYKDNGDENYKTFNFRHRGKANVAFCDGHVDSIEPMYDLDDGNCSWVDNKLMDRK